MRAPKRTLILSVRDYKRLLHYTLEYRNQLIAENKCTDYYNDLIIKLQYKAK